MVEYQNILAVWCCRHWDVCARGRGGEMEEEALWLVYMQPYDWYTWSLKIQCKLKGYSKLFSENLFAIEHIGKMPLQNYIQSSKMGCQKFLAWYHRLLCLALQAFVFHAGFVKIWMHWISRLGIKLLKYYIWVKGLTEQGVILVRFHKTLNFFIDWCIQNCTGLENVVLSDFCWFTFA